ncbi:hypothetical protein M427DRAFT_350185 [Gonapodya prolifera JEL478]|uniref:Uncharacterized protein n=1 Tax=Gonapodya prolifera (strain JEL478) TaxID=1344416 RepID=A0A139AWB5_GONPJ|nr:hypothetical protein M427DRAFT_350185 [Gonapodya prolifera JEL478]|eukprot:KXS20999.1 hypothetical protein M427DRAFT_350185 [Gonapodya prolifera JEL478]
MLNDDFLLNTEETDDDLLIFNEESGGWASTSFHRAAGEPPFQQLKITPPLSPPDSPKRKGQRDSQFHEVKEATTVSHTGLLKPERCPKRTGTGPPLREFTACYDPMYIRQRTPTIEDLRTPEWTEHLCDQVAALLESWNDLHEQETQSPLYHNITNVKNVHNYVGMRAALVCWLCNTRRKVNCHSLRPRHLSSLCDHRKLKTI